MVRSSFAGEWARTRETSHLNYDSATLAKQLRPHFPSVAFTKIERIREGGDFANYDVDGTLIVRIPLTSAWARGLAIERELLPRLRPLLPVVIPVFEHVREPDTLFPYGLAVYRKIQGVSGEVARPASVVRARCAARLGRTLSALHSFDIDEARSIGVETASPPAGAELIERIAGYADLIRRRLPAIVVDDVARFLAGAVAPPPAGAVRAVLLHRDLKGEHFILNERADDIAGILDWADASIGDPATDFVGAALWLGMPFVEQVLLHYTLPVDHEFVARVRWNNQAWRLIQLGMTLANEWDAPPELILRQVHLAFSLAE